jgi:NADH dehydrogenase
MLLAYEAAEREQDDEIRQEWLTFVVIGAGPTGVEMAGALAEIAQRTMARNFRNFDPESVKVYLLEGKDSVLPVFPSERLRRSAHAQLKDLGVQVRLNTFVEEIHDDCVKLSDGDPISTRTVVWAAGVKAESIADKLGTTQDRAGRLEVGSDLLVEGLSEVFAIGDIAACTDAAGVEVPGLAPAATQMGEHAAMNIKRLMAGHDTLTYTYLDKGQMATIGRSKAIAKSGPLEFTGLIAWFAWLFIHILYLIDFRNRVAVIFDWAWAYITFQRSARVIIDAPKRLPAPQQPVGTATARPHEEE